MDSMLLLLMAVSLGVLALGNPRRLRVRKSKRSAKAAGRPLPTFGVLEAAEMRLRRVPFDRMGESERRIVIDLLRRADAEVAPDRVHARINTTLGEMALVAGDSDQAIERFRKALRWDPQAPVRRTLARLERRSILDISQAA